jgi:Mg-chelatase subunit ChlI
VSTAHPLGTPDAVGACYTSESCQHCPLHCGATDYERANRKAKWFFWSAGDTAQDAVETAAEKANRAGQRVGERAAHLYQEGKAKTKGWFGQVKSKLDDLSEDASLELQKRKHKAKAMYHGAASQYYDVRERARHAMDRSIHNGAYVPSSPVSDDEVDSTKMREWVSQTRRSMFSPQYDAAIIADYVDSARYSGGESLLDRWYRYLQELGDT